MKRWLYQSRNQRRGEARRRVWECKCPTEGEECVMQLKEDGFGEKFTEMKRR